MEHLLSTYARLPVAFDHGQGAWLWDQDGNRYLDAISGVGVCCLGHAHPEVTAALCAQAERLIHTSNMYRIPAQEQLAAQLTAVSGMERAFFCNSGAEAIEAALKLARLYGHSKGIQQPAVIVTEQAFHGRTLATLSASGSRKVQAGFEPLVQGFVRAPFNDLAALETIAANTPNVVAILVEPIQGEAGVNIPDDDYLPGIRRLCDRQGWLMMLDEIQTGLCRTGRWFAHQYHEVTPDVMAVAKGLGNGLPIGACLTRGPVSDLFRPGNHGSTFGGNPLACHTALAVLHTLKTEQLAERAQVLGERLLNGLAEGLANCGVVRSIRGRGLMVGIELNRACGPLTQRGLEAGILFSVQAEKVVRLLPPLIIDDAEAAQIVERVGAVIRRFDAEPAG